MQCGWEINREAVKGRDVQQATNFTIGQVENIVQAKGLF
jgi:hypothetical protein